MIKLIWKWCSFYKDPYLGWRAFIWIKYKKVYHHYSFNLYYSFRHESFDNIKTKIPKIINI